MPDWKSEVVRRLTGLRLDPTHEAAIVDEWVHHLEDRYDELRREGLTENEAWRKTIDELDQSDLTPVNLGRAAPPDPVPAGAAKSGNWIARERASEAAASVEWVMEDMRRFTRPAMFDLACNMFTSFGYFADEEDNLRVLRNVHESLRDGGVFVMEMLGKERLARVWQGAICTEHPDGSLLLQRPQVRDDCSRVRNEWTILKDGRYRSFRFEHSIYSGGELKDRLAVCGFKQVDLFGDLQGTPYGLDAARLVAVARKV